MSDNISNNEIESMTNSQIRQNMTDEEILQLQLSKNRLVEILYINDCGCSSFIKRSELPESLSWTSGDSVFRNDGILAEKFKLVRYSKNFDMNEKVSRQWLPKMTQDEKDLIIEHHQSLTFERNGRYVEYIRFYGFLDGIHDEGINSSIREEIIRRPCVHCGCTRNIQCDHKNSLYRINCPRVCNRETQTIDDFQPLCGSCNSLKSRHESRARRNNKRYGATNFGYTVDFLVGDETLDENDPNWYIGTYWGDVLRFRQNLSLRDFNVERLFENLNIN